MNAANARNISNSYEDRLLERVFDYIRSAAENGEYEVVISSPEIRQQYFNLLAKKLKDCNYRVSIVQISFNPPILNISW